MNSPAELHLLASWQDQDRARRHLAAGIGSALVHVFFVLGGFAIAAYMPEPRPPAPSETLDVRKSISLVMPSTLTQREVSHAAPAKEIHLENLTARATIPAAPKVFAPPPGARPAALPPPAPVIEAPTVKVAQAPVPSLGVPEAPAAPPPATPPEKPKLAFETPGAYAGRPAGSGQIAVPKVDLQAAMRNASRPGPGDLSVGDSVPESASPFPGRPGSPARQASKVDLLSDPQGVDFKPYLTRVMTAIRQNWFAVWPESARFGQAGQVSLIFAIDHAGGVPKLVIETPSGTNALDRAAVAGINASTPFPPLPAEYKGDTLRLRLVFYYNIQR